MMTLMPTDLHLLGPFAFKPTTFFFFFFLFFCSFILYMPELRSLGFRFFFFWLNVMGFK